MNALLWLASYPKSGNTWMRMLFANYLAKRDEPLPINEVGRYGIGDAIRPLYGEAIGPMFPTFDELQTLKARPKVLAFAARKAGKILLAKTHNRNDTIRGVPLIPPELTRAAIYIVRNPLDMLLSYADHYGLTPDLAAQAIGSKTNRIAADKGNVTQYLGGWSAHVTGWLDNRTFPVHCVRYESLSEDTLGTFRGVLTWLGFDIDEARMQRAVEFSRFDELRRQEDAGGFVERSQHGSRFFRSGQVGAGREQLPEAVVARITREHGRVMKRLGYLE